MEVLEAGGWRRGDGWISSRGVHAPLTGSRHPEPASSEHVRLFTIHNLTLLYSGGRKAPLTVWAGGTQAKQK